ncbi:MAG: hypothetical protein QNI89_01345 [Desulfobacterales bacterium]|nr:hypothetical protein [Desulfobacterales bacterium]MDJ0885907.1 hypothetical protein [Desulfobacterales bacterium]
MGSRPVRRARSFAGDRRGICALCGRETELTFHHLIPRKMHRRNHFKKHYARDQLAKGIDVCRLCHDGIHALYDEMTLARSLCTAGQLKRDPQVRRHITWVRKQKRR